VPSGAPVAVVEGRAKRRAARRRVHVIEPPRGGVRGALHDLWVFRWAILYFGSVYLSRRYRRTWLGFLWVPLKPGFNMASRILIFGGVVGISAGKTPYPIFLLIATAAWQLFAETVLWGTRSMEMGAKLLQRVELPRLPMIFGAVLPGSIEFFTYLLFAAIGLGYYMLRAHKFYLHLGIQTLFVPAGLTLIVLQAVGIGLVLSGASARARDVRYGMHFGLNFLYLATPVLYPLSQIPAAWRPLAELNPVMGAIEMVKDGLFDSHELTLAASLVAICGTVVFWAIGIWMLHRSGARRRAVVAGG
jgi:ABC-type polysaccharide/polyol phosphate export permease